MLRLPRSRCNVIQFALTAAGTEWVIFFLMWLKKTNKKKQTGLHGLFLYSLEPVLHKQRSLKTSEDTRRKQDVSETERRTLLNTVFGK